MDLLRHKLARLRHLRVAVAARLDGGGRANCLCTKHCTLIRNLVLAAVMQCLQRSAPSDD